MDLYRSPEHAPESALLDAGMSEMSALAPGRIYALVAARLPDGSGRPRPILRLRRQRTAPCGAAAQNAAGQNKGEQPPARPFVLRASLGERIQVQVTNLLAGTPLFLALVDDDYGIIEDCEVAVLAHGETRTYVWNCRHAGVYPMYNLMCPDPVERRSLLGVLIVEP